MNLDMLTLKKFSSKIWLCIKKTKKTIGRGFLSPHHFCKIPLVVQKHRYYAGLAT